VRIIGGEYRGRRLPALRGLVIRPTADRIRESIFSILGTLTLDAVVLDLFAGTGALGLEALSRGAAAAVFVDRSGRALSLVARSLRMLGVDRKARVIRWDIAKNLDCVRETGVTPNVRTPDAASGSVLPGFDLVFADPPYNRNLVQKALTHLDRSEALAQGAVVVVEHSPDEPIPDSLSGYQVADRRRYGSTCVSFLRTMPGPDA